MMMRLSGRTLLPVLCASIASAFKAAPPSMPLSWAAESMQKVVLFQGGVYNDTTGVACCKIGFPQCKVQAEGLSGNYYVDGKQRRTALSLGMEAEIHANGKNIIATPAASGKGWNCTSWCPSTKFEDPIVIPDTAKDEGAHSDPRGSGKMTEKFTWYDGLGESSLQCNLRTLACGLTL